MAPDGHAPEAPPPDCAACPRLVAFRHRNLKAYPGYHNRPVRSFGPLTARLLIVGLAPGLHGANQTGRPFTGDYAGDLLYETLGHFGFAAGCYGASAEDGLSLVDTRITNAVRCVPPENKPVGAEVNACRRYLESEISDLQNIAVIVALGGIAHRTVLKSVGARQVSFPFSHGAEHKLADRLILIDSYHCSRYNTNTGKLTPEMFRDVFGKVRTHLSGTMPRVG